MYTEFGKFLRSLRSTHTELLKDMAENLGVTSAFLSGVESGKKSIPAWMPEKIIELYALFDTQVSDLRKAVDVSQRSVTIDLIGVGVNGREVAVALARRFGELTQGELDMLKRTMDAVKDRVKDD